MHTWGRSVREVLLGCTLLGRLGRSDREVLLGCTPLGRSDREVTVFLKVERVNCCRFST